MFDDREPDKLITALIVIAGAFAAWGLWIGEVIWLKGWAGLAWLAGFNWSSFPISVVIMAVSSYVIARRAGWRDRMIFVGLGSVLALAAFAAARWAAYELSSVTLGASALTPVAVIVVSWLIAAAGLPVLANWRLTSFHVWTAPLLALGLILVLPLSAATIKVLPALNGSMDELHAIKMGYPVFWAALIVPLALRIGRKPNRGVGRPRADD